MHDATIHARVPWSWALLAIVAIAVLCLPGLSAAGAPAHGEKAAPAASAQTAKHNRVTLESAVAQVQKRTNGKVLGADTQHRGHTIEYRIKVLTPNGHVRVVPVRTRAKALKNKENH